LGSFLRRVVVNALGRRCWKTDQDRDGSHAPYAQDRAPMAKLVVPRGFFRNRRRSIDRVRLAITPENEVSNAANAKEHWNPPGR